MEDNDRIAERKNILQGLGVGLFIFYFAIVILSLTFPMYDWLFLILGLFFSCLVVGSLIFKIVKLNSEEVKHNGKTI